MHHKKGVFSFFSTKLSRPTYLQHVIYFLKAMSLWINLGCLEPPQGILWSVRFFLTSWDLKRLYHHPNPCYVVRGVCKYKWKRGIQASNWGQQQFRKGSVWRKGGQEVGINNWFSSRAVGSKLSSSTLPTLNLSQFELTACYNMDFAKKKWWHKSMKMNKIQQNKGEYIPIFKQMWKLEIKNCFPYLQF